MRLALQGNQGHGPLLLGALPDAGLPATAEAGRDSGQPGRRGGEDHRPGVGGRSPGESGLTQGGVARPGPGVGEGRHQAAGRGRGRRDPAHVATSSPGLRRPGPRLPLATPETPRAGKRLSGPRKIPPSGGILVFQLWPCLAAARQLWRGEPPGLPFALSALDLRHGHGTTRA